MEETTVDSVTIKKRWLVPHKVVNKGTTYERRPVDNFPEFMLSMQRSGQTDRLVNR